MLFLLTGKSDLYSHHANCNNLFIRLRGFSSNGAGTSQVLNPETIVLPDDVCDDVPDTGMKTRVKGVSDTAAVRLLYESNQGLVVPGLAPFLYMATVNRVGGADTSVVLWRQVEVLEALHGNGKNF